MHFAHQNWCWLIKHWCTFCWYWNLFRLKLHLHFAHGNLATESNSFNCTVFVSYLYGTVWLRAAFISPDSSFVIGFTYSTEWLGIKRSNCCGWIYLQRRYINYIYIERELAKISNMKVATLRFLSSTKKWMMAL